MALRIEIKGYISDLQAKLAQAKSSLRGFANSASVQIGRIGAGFLAAFGVQALFRYLKDIGDQMDQVGKASARLGISTKAYQEMAFAAKLAGVSMDRFTLAMSALGPFMLNAANSSSRQAKALRLLNLEYSDLAKMSPEKQFNTITRAVDQLSNATERVGVSRLIFGRAGFEVLGMASNMEAAREKMKGALIGDDQIRAAEEFNDALALMDKQLRALIANFGIFKTASAWLSRAQEEGIAGTLLRQAYEAQKTMIFGPLKYLPTDILSNEGAAINKRFGGAESGPAQRAAQRKARENAAASSVADIFGEKGSSGGGSTNQIFSDALRRIGGMSSSSNVGGFANDPAYMTSEFLRQWLPVIAEVAKSIDKKTPSPNSKGLF